MVEIDTVEPRSTPPKTDGGAQVKQEIPQARLVSSPMLVRLASRLGLRVNDITSRLSPETVRATKFPVHETANTDGTYTYRQPSRIIEDPRQR